MTYVVFVGVPGFRLSFFEMILRISCLLVPKLQRLVDALKSEQVLYGFLRLDQDCVVFFGSSFSNILHKKRAAQNLLTHDIECFGDGRCFTCFDIFIFKHLLW